MCWLLVRATITWSNKGHKKDMGFGAFESDSRSEEDRILLAIRKLESSRTRAKGRMKVGDAKLLSDVPS